MAGIHNPGYQPQFILTMVGAGMTANKHKDAGAQVTLKKKLEHRRFLGIFTGGTRFHLEGLGDKISVMSQVDLLYRLQQIDDAIRDSKKRLAQVISLQKESSDLEAARRSTEVAAEDLKNWRGKQNVLNLELSALNEKAKQEEIRLYSGMVKNPKELEEIQYELESLGRRGSALEDELIEAMIMVEDREREAIEAEQELEAIETTWVKDQESLNIERGELITTINDLIKQRKELLTIVSGEAMAAYHNAIRRAGNPAVVLLKGSRCSGCQVTIPANLVKSTEDGNLVVCDNCSRVLCLM